MMKKLIGISAVFLVFVCSIYSQSSRDVFAPFVSRINGTSEDGTIKLTWKGSTDVDGSYLIYRHTEEINTNNFINAVKVGDALKGSDSFVDYPETTGTYFYAVLIKGDNNKVYELFIPFRNKTTKGIVLDNLGTESELAAIISDIDTQVQRDSILVTFSSSKEDRDLIIYRSTSPLTQSTDLAYAQALRAIPSSRSSFQDFPVPGISYYYAIIDSGLVKIGEISFKPSGNSTIIPASIPVGSRIGLPETTVSRNLPLPLLPLSLKIETGEQLDSPQPTSLPSPRPLDSATTKAITALLENLPEQNGVELKPVILDEDKGSIVSGGEEYTLKSILNNEFAEKRWLESEKLLKNFLSVHRSPSIEQRAHFYLGQVLYFQEKYQDSFMQFILIKDDMYTKTTPWIDRLFSLIIKI